MEARTARRPARLLQGPEPAAERAAGQGHRRLHRSGAGRPRHLRAALRAGQPVPPPRRIRARRARAPASAVARRPRRSPSAIARSTRWRRISSRPGCSTARSPPTRRSKGTAFDHEAALALLSLYERSREWAKAAEVSEQLEGGRHRQLREPHRQLLVRTGAGSPGPSGRAAGAPLADQARERAPQSARA